MRGELEATRAFILEVVGEGLGQAWAAQREDAEAAIAEATATLKV
jgi:hypothetical protein